MEQPENPTLLELKPLLDSKKSDLADEIKRLLNEFSQQTGFDVYSINLTHQQLGPNTKVIKVAIHLIS